MSWDIRPGRDQEYFEFVVREFAPGITRLGLQLTEAWSPSTANASNHDGDYPDFDTMKSLLDSKEWQELHERLLQLSRTTSRRWCVLARLPVVTMSPGGSASSLPVDIMFSGGLVIFESLLARWGRFGESGLWFCRWPGWLPVLRCHRPMTWFRPSVSAHRWRRDSAYPAIGDVKA
jgi:hypothetical protein